MEHRRRFSRSVRAAFSAFLGLGVAGSLLAVASPAGADIRINDGDDCPAVIAPVANLYEAFFLREPDPQGLDYWVQFVSGTEGSLSAAATAFAASPEFVERYGELTTEEFVTQLYPNVFGRPADARGLAFWVEDIDSGTRTRSEVIVVWTFSEEFLGPDPYFSPLVYDIFRKEVWCGTGSTTIDIDRIPLDVGQQIAVRAVDAEDESYATIYGVSESGTVLLTAGGPVTLVQSQASLYVHPNVGQAVHHYRIQINDFAAENSGDPVEWVIVSEWRPPPWQTF